MVEMKRILAELLGTCWLVYFGCGYFALTATAPCADGGDSPDHARRLAGHAGHADHGFTAVNQGAVLAAAFAWGAVYMTVHWLYGADSNPAVTIAHIINGDMSPVQGIIDIVAQGLGAILGSTLLLLTIHDTVFECRTGQNLVTPYFHNEHAFIAEALVTFFVVTAVLEIKSNANCSPAAVGLAYFLATLFLFPIDGCSVNPARSFAPAVVGSLHGSHDDSVSDTDKFWTNHWIFWVGPIVGAIIAAVWRKLTGDSSAEAEPPAAADEVESELEKVA